MRRTEAMGQLITITGPSSYSLGSKGDPQLRV